MEWETRCCGTAKLVLDVERRDGGVLCLPEKVVLADGGCGVDVVDGVLFFLVRLHFRVLSINFLSSLLPMQLVSLSLLLRR